MTAKPEGQRQLLPNVMASGIAYAIAAVIGFVMPRLIYDAVGSIALGLWDLAWSFLLYVTFTGIGLGRAIAHFSSSYRATGNTDAERRVLTTGLYCQLGFAALVVAGFGAGLWSVSLLTGVLSSEDADMLAQTAWTLSAAVGFVVIGDAAHGMLLGNHKARLNEIINISHDLLLAVSMVTVLWLDMGIVGLAMVTAGLRFVAEIIRFVFATRYNPGFTLSPAFLSGAAARRLVRYGLKTSASMFQELVVLQTARLALFLSAGPIALAAFSRYATLVRQINRLIDHLSISIPALTSELFAQGQKAQIRELYINSTRAALLMMLPVLLVFWVFGDAIVSLWMGPEFVQQGLAWMLGGACVLHAHYSISVRVMSGVNDHGRIALACLFASSIAIVVGTAMNYPVQMQAAAYQVSVVVFMTVHLPFVVFAVWRLGVSWFELITRAYLLPLTINAMFAGVLLCADGLIAAGYLMAGWLVVVTAIPALLTAYWLFALPESARTFLRSALSGSARIEEAAG